MPLLQCCCPAPGGIRTYSVQSLGMDNTEAQGIDDLFKKLCEELGCRDAKVGVLGYLHRGTIKAFKANYPQANEQCIVESVGGIVAAIGKACAVCPDENRAMQIFFSEAAPFIAKLLGCIFGQQRGQQIEVNFWRNVATQSAGLISCLLTTLLPILCRIPQQPTGGGWCNKPAPGPDNPIPPFPPEPFTPAPNTEERCEGQ